MAGIVCGDTCPESVYAYGLIAVGISALFLCLFYKHKLWFGLTLYLFLFFLGNQLLFFQKQKGRVDWEEEKMLYTGVLQDHPQEKVHSFLLPLEVQQHKVLLYVAKDSFPEDLRRGRLIHFYARIVSPANPEIPGQFNYARYLQRQGVTGTAYVGNEYWKPGEKEISTQSLKQKALDIRDRLLERYRLLGFQGDELAVLSALTLGDKSELRNDLKETFSVAGASHVLALSGLHLGIVYGICAFLFSFLSIGRSTLWIRMCCTVGVLWAFSFMVGLSASVVRSACMFSLIAVGQCLNRKSISLNTLALSAFLMLWYQPFYLFDVGFQLSYAAVASIIVFHPFVFHWWKPTWKILRYIWGIVAVSLVVQIGVAPLIIYYFSRFPVYFLLTNLLVIPLTFCLIAGAILMLLCGFCLPLQKGVAFILNELIKMMHSGLTWIERMPLSVIDEVEVSCWGIICFYLFVVFLVSYSLRKNARYLVGALACVVYMVAVPFFSLFFVETSRMLFYHSMQGVSVQCTYAGKDSFELFPMQEKSDVKRFHGKTIAVVKDNGWHNRGADMLFPIDYLVIQRGFTGYIAELQNVFFIRKIVLDTSLSLYQQKRLLKECEELKIEVFSLSEQGYLLVEV